MQNEIEVVLVKIGGSSITKKAEIESLDDESLNWFAKSLSSSIADRFRAPNHDDNPSARQTAFVVIHGAGSFGHFTAKKYGLKGQTEKPNNKNTEHSRYRKRGLAETRLSVQKLNQLVVSTFFNHGINAVSISPFSIPGLEAHANKQDEPVQALENVVRRTVQSGLVPVLHGDACLYGDDVGILSGDTLMEVLGKCDWVTDTIFITDVDGVFDKEPRENPNAQLLRHISVDPSNGNITTELTASCSSHEHDVTGGLEVSSVVVP